MGLCLTTSPVNEITTTLSQSSSPTPASTSISIDDFESMGDHPRARIRRSYSDTDWNTIKRHRLNHDLDYSRLTSGRRLFHLNEGSEEFSSTTSEESQDVYCSQEDEYSSSTTSDEHLRVFRELKADDALIATLLASSDDSDDFRTPENSDDLDMSDISSD